MSDLRHPPGFPVGPPPAPPLGSLPWPPEIGASVHHRRARGEEPTATSVEAVRVVEFGSGDLRTVKLGGVGWAPWDRCEGVGL